ncbi:hypothetical protein AAHH97_11750, partial [Mycolicibacterium elephantis]
PNTPPPNQFPNNARSPSIHHDSLITTREPTPIRSPPPQGALSVLVALGAAVFAWFQVREARRTREERAQPNVVIYTELNPSVKQFIEIVVRNFGVTPAYNVKIAIDPPLKATPNLVSGDQLADVDPRIPDFSAWVRMANRSGPCGLQEKNTIGFGRVGAGAVG